jgi:DinB superfamily
MSEIDGMRERVEAARGEYAGLPRDGWGEPGPADEQTGERWDRGNVLGHVAEMLPFWTVQIRTVLAGGGEMGRDAVGIAQRRMGIDSGREAGEDVLLTRIDEGIAGLQALLAEMRDDDLDRPLRFLGHSGERETDVRYALEYMLVRHLEEHLGQLRALDG